VLGGSDGGGGKRGKLWDGLGSVRLLGARAMVWVQCPFMRNVDLSLCTGQLIDH
jgi:hypothetical protein